MEQRFKIQKDRRIKKEMTDESAQILALRRGSGHENAGKATFLWL